MDNVMLAPHNSNSSPLAWERVHQNTIRNLLNGLGIEVVMQAGAPYMENLNNQLKGDLP
jgi:phosphoglycerate dehydrogenase-like enzyme